MAEAPKVLVAGGTGRLGTSVVRRLLRSGLEVRVLTRDPERAAHLGQQVEVVRGDVKEAASLRSAMTDVSVVVSAVHGFAGPGRISPASVDRAGNVNLIDAAAEVGAEFVLMSIVGAAPDSPVSLFRAKHDAETYLRESGLPWTVIRATSFVELWAELVGKGMVFGRGDNPINFVASDDVAFVVERAVTGERLRGRIIEIGGPEDLTFNELAVLVREHTGRPERVRHVPRSALRLMAPFHRMPRLSLAMDTEDMTFRASGEADVGLPPTNVRTALGAYGRTAT